MRAWIKWLVETEAYDPELPEGMTPEVFLAHWRDLAPDFARSTGGLLPQEVNQLIWHSSHHIGDMLWTQDVELEIKLAAVRAAPTVLREASARGTEVATGCYMFWENVLLPRREVDGDDLLLRTIGRALADQVEMPDDNLRRSAEHGLEHYREVAND